MGMRLLLPGRRGDHGVLSALASSSWGRSPASLAPTGGWKGAGSPSGCRGGSGQPQDGLPRWGSLGGWVLSLCPTMG